MNSPDQARQVASDLRRLVSDASTIASHMRSLIYLFDKAIDDDGSDTKLTTASYLVGDCIRTMAARIDALETRAAALYEPFSHACKPVEQMKNAA